MKHISTIFLMVLILFIPVGIGKFAVEQFPSTEKTLSISNAMKCAQGMNYTSSGLRRLGEQTEFIPLGKEQFILARKKIGSIFIYNTHFGVDTEIDSAAGTALSLDGSKHNFRVPYLPSSPNEAEGFFYLAADRVTKRIDIAPDQAYSVPSFIPGDAQEFPIFQPTQLKGGLTAYTAAWSCPDRERYSALPIEQELLREHAVPLVTDKARKELLTYIGDHLPALPRAFSMSLHRQLAIPVIFLRRSPELKLQIEKKARSDYREILEVCTAAAADTDSAYIKAALKSLPATFDPEEDFNRISARERKWAFREHPEGER